MDDDPKVYLERELGLEKAGRLYGTEAKVWRWDMRWFRSGETEQENVSITPRGDLVGFEFVRKDDAPGPRPAEAEARALASAFLAERGLGPQALAFQQAAASSQEPAATRSPLAASCDARGQPSSRRRSWQSSTARCRHGSSE